VASRPRRGDRGDGAGRPVGDGGCAAPELGGRRDDGVIGHLNQSWPCPCGDFVDENEICLTFDEIDVDCECQISYTLDKIVDEKIDHILSFVNNIPTID
jgi:hypothetical protein